MDKKRRDNIYIYLWEELNTIYIGRTVNPKSRHYQHRHIPTEKTYKFSSEHGVEHPKMVIIENNLTIEEGVEREKYWINEYREKSPFNVLNKLKGGQVGKLSQLTEEERENRRKLWYSLHKDDMLRWAREYYNRNKEKCNEKNRKYKKKHKEKIKEYRKNWYEEHKDKEKNYQKKYYNEHKEELKETLKQYRKNYYENNKNKILESSKTYRENNKEKIRQRDRERYQKRKEERKEYMKKYLITNRERLKEYKKNWYKNHKNVK